MAPVENSNVTKKEAPSYTHVEAHQFRPILMDSSPKDKLMDLINNKGWDGHTVYDRKKDIFTTALYLAAEAENTSVISWLLKWSPNKAKDILEANSFNGRTALHAAAATKYPAVVRRLLKELKDAKQVNVVDKEGNTPLHIAVEKQNVIVIIARLLRAGADPCQKNNEGDAPLHLSVKGGNLEVLKQLLSVSGVSVDTPDLAKGQTLLHLAVKGGNLKVLKEPLSDADTSDSEEDVDTSDSEEDVDTSDSGEDVDTPDSGKGQTLLDLAVGKDMVVMLIDKGADPCRKNEGESPLHLAALQVVEEDESEVFQLLLHTALKARLEKAESVEDITNALEEVRKQEDGAFTEALDALKYGWNIDNDVVYGNKTALHLASEIGNETLVKALLKSKPEVRVVNLQDELGNTALHFAASGGYFGIVKLLLDASADAKQQNKKGDSPLHYAVGPQGKDEIVTELLKAGAETDKRNELGQTPLHFAVAQERADIAGKLADKGADFHLKDNTGAGVLHFAARGGGPDIFKLLKDKLKEDLDVNQATAKAGLTPLHFAAWNGNIQALDWLLKFEGPEFKGIKLDARDKVEEGMPWQWAAMGGKGRCLRRLIYEHVERRIPVFPGSHKDWKRVFQRIEDHTGRNDWVVRAFLERSEVEKDSLVLEPGILSCAAAYGDIRTNRCLVRILTNQLNLDQQKSIKDSRLMEWAALSSIRSIEFGGKDRFKAVKVVMEFLMKKYPGVEGINNQLRLAFKIAFLNADQCKYEKQGRNTFAKCMAECFTWELPNMIKEAIWKELIKQFKDKYETLAPGKLHKDVFNDESELAEDVPVAYWEAKLEEDESFKGSKGAVDLYNAKKKDDDGGGKQRKQLAQRVKQYSEKSIKDYFNDTGRRTGRTALHWATIFNEPDTVIALSAKGCKPDTCDTFGNLPYWDALSMSNLEENTVVMNCLKWDGCADILDNNRQMFMDDLNAILVVSALIASITFGGCLNPPLQYSFKFKDRQYVSMDITGVQVFWVANSLSFFLAMGACAALAPVTAVLHSDKFDLRLLRRFQHTVIAAASMLVCSIIFVLVAFGAAGFSALPPLPKYQRNMIFPSVYGALVCIGPLLTFTYAVYNLISGGRFSSWLNGQERRKRLSSWLNGQKRRKEVEDDQKCAKMRFGSATLEEVLSSKVPEELQRELLSGKMPEELQRELLSGKMPEELQRELQSGKMTEKRLRELFPPQSPRRYTHNGQLPWEDGLDSLVQTDGETVRAQDESLHTSCVQRGVQDERDGAADARTDQEDEGRSGQTVITVTHS